MFTELSSTYWSSVTGVVGEKRRHNQYADWKVHREWGWAGQHMQRLQHCLSEERAAVMIVAVA
eukprot:940064-Rhodomonas_salina.1